MKFASTFAKGKAAWGQEKKGAQHTSLLSSSGSAQPLLAFIAALRKGAGTSHPPPFLCVLKLPPRWDPMPLVSCGGDWRVRVRVRVWVGIGVGIGFGAG